VNRNVIGPGVSGRRQSRRDLRPVPDVTSDPPVIRRHESPRRVPTVRLNSNLRLLRKSHFPGSGFRDVIPSPKRIGTK